VNWPSADSSSDSQQDFLFEIPSNLILHKIGARVWIARILITWGTIAPLTGFVQSAHQLYVARFALGLAEAGDISPVSFCTWAIGSGKERKHRRLP
jgi:hypothetical protein